MIILMVTDNTAPLAALAAALEQRAGIEVRFAASGDAGFDFLQRHRVDLVIIDQWLDQGSGIAFAKQLVKSHPLVNIAIVGTEDDEAFHQATEGLGVLMQLPPQAGAVEAEKLLTALERIGALLQSSTPPLLAGGRS
jgi:DNA-binding NarL/FixJ family response regulator